MGGQFGQALGHGLGDPTSYLGPGGLPLKIGGAALSSLGAEGGRQTLMFSATWPTGIQKLAADFMCRPAKVTIGSKGLSASHSVTQVGRLPCPVV